MPRTRYAGGVPIAAKQLCRIATGTYIGDGTTGNAITGIGFRPRYLIVYKESGGTSHVFWKTDTMTAARAARHTAGGGHSTNLADLVIALGPDGFTVDDGGANLDPNVSGATYMYVALG